MRHARLPVDASWAVSLAHPAAEWGENSPLWEPDTPTFALFPCRRQPQGRAAAKAAAAEGPDSDAGCSRELRQGNRESYSRLALQLGVTGGIILFRCWRGHRGDVPSCHWCVPPPSPLRTPACARPCTATGSPS